MHAQRPSSRSDAAPTPRPHLLSPLQAGVPDQATRILEQLTHNAVLENRFESAAHYFYQLAMEALVVGAGGGFIGQSGRRGALRAGVVPSGVERVPSECACGSDNCHLQRPLAEMEGSEPRLRLTRASFCVVFVLQLPTAMSAGHQDPASRHGPRGPQAAGAVH